jgi:molybdopterin-guanine dinucleotide biosynthesis protein A
MRKQDDLTGIILAGGKNIRMGQDKAFMKLGRKRLIDYSLDLMQTVTGRVIISANKPGYDMFSVPVVQDNYLNIGPLGGMEACLRFSNTTGNLFMPCDTPFLTVDFWTLLLSNTGKYDAVIPISDNGKTEPLTGYYSREILPKIVAQIEKGDYKVQNLLKKINTKFLPLENPSLLKNINSPKDFGEATRETNNS